MITPKKYKGIDLSSTYLSKRYGEFKVVSISTSRDITIRFLKTGFVATTTAGQIRDGTVKDKMLPIANGVGFIGNGEYRSQISGVPTHSYEIWRAMIGRCYCVAYLKNNPTYIDCTVCEEWHNFQNFAEWYGANYIEGFDLDKDIKVKGNRVYGPDTCIFASKKDNYAESGAKDYSFTSPSGCKVNVHNLSDFCAENKLCSSHMVKVSKSIRASHKGWTKA